MVTFPTLNTMNHLTILILTTIFLASCSAPRPINNNASTPYPDNDPLITQSLFNDKNATISEENIQKILAGSYQLPQQLRVAVVRLENTAQQRRYLWGDEQHLKTQQAYLDLFAEKLRQSPRVTSVSIIPDLLISKSPSFTQIREAAVRMQADIAVVYSINSDIYSKYKLFSKPDIKAFATTQLIVLDIRTGLVPFSAIVTKDTLSQKKKEELDQSEAVNRIQNEAVLLTIHDIGQQIATFLDKK